MKFSTFWLSMFSDSEGEGISSKRVIGVVGFILIIIISMIDLFTTFQVSEFVYDGIMYIVIACFFSNSLETFSKRSGKGPTVNVNDATKVDVNTSSEAKTMAPTTAAAKSKLIEVKNEVKSALVGKLEENEIIG